MVASYNNFLGKIEGDNISPWGLSDFAKGLGDRGTRLLEMITAESWDACGGELENIGNLLDEDERAAELDWERLKSGLSVSAQAMRQLDQLFIAV